MKNRFANAEVDVNDRVMDTADGILLFLLITELDNILIGSRIPYSFMGIFCTDVREVLSTKKKMNKPRVDVFNPAGP